MTIIKFPETSYILKCKDCKINAFYIYLASTDPFDIIGYECCECGEYWDVPQKSIELMSDDV